MVCVAAAPLFLLPRLHLPRLARRGCVVVVEEEEAGGAASGASITGSGVRRLSTGPSQAGRQASLQLIMVVSQDSVDAASKFASKLARFELLSKRNLPFRHPDFSDDQIRQLTDIARSYKSSSSVASKRSTSRPHSGCSSPILSPTIQRLRAEGFPAAGPCWL
ncbi:uncharacterized protein [Panulirus ornatus]|uniref:uncharacterized protein isoform X1 n=1 Tax=Panulirus ornatus TaxID=150431 RepID=UPI003A8961E7